MNSTLDIASIVDSTENPSSKSSSDPEIIKSESNNEFSKNIIDNYVLIWLDSNINEFSDNYKQHITQLRSVSNTIYIFTDPKECVSFIANSSSKKIFMIISNVSYQHIVA